MTKRFHSQPEICHLFVEQSPDCTSADLRGGNLNFSGPTLTSFGWWPLAHWTGRTVQEPRGQIHIHHCEYNDAASQAEIVTKRVLLRNNERSGHGGFNSDGHQQNILGGALRGREDYVEIGISHDLLKAYIKTIQKADRAARDHREWNDKIEAYETVPGDPAETERLRDEAWRTLGEALVERAKAALKARAERYAKPTVTAYLDQGRDEGDTGSDVSRDARIADLTTEAIEARMTQFGLMGVPVTPKEMEEIRDVIRLGYAAYNDPKKVKARETNAKRAALKNLQEMVKRFMTNKESYRYRAAKMFDGYSRHETRTLDVMASPPWVANQGGREIIKAAFKTHPVESAKLMSQVSAALAKLEQRALEAKLYPDARAIVQQRLYGSRYHKYITPEQWVAGEKGSLRYDSEERETTLVRVEGVGGNREIVTSRGARVPFKDGVRLYSYAAGQKFLGKAWKSEEHAQPVKVGYYTLNSIDANGDCRIGCHRLDFIEMERLAVREVPHLVKARYPLPSPYLAPIALKTIVRHHLGRHEA